MRSSLLAIGALACTATAAHADPCKAVPDRGPAPVELLRQPFTGRATYVGDGDSLCVARGPLAADWIEVRLADFYAPELQEPGGEQAKAALSRLVMGRTLTCQPRKQSYDRLVAVCYRDGRSVGDLMRASGVSEGGRGR